MPQAEDVEIEILPKDLRIDTLSLIHIFQYSTHPFQGTLGTNLRAGTATHPPPGDFGLVQGKAAQASLLAGKLL